MFNFYLDIQNIDKIVKKPLDQAKVSAGVPNYVFFGNRKEMTFYLGM